MSGQNQHYKESLVTKIDLKCNYCHHNIPSYFKSLNHFSLLYVSTFTTIVSNVVLSIINVIVHKAMSQIIVIYLLRSRFMRCLNGLGFLQNIAKRLSKGQFNMENYIFFLVTIQIEYYFSNIIVFVRITIISVQVLMIL